MKKLNYTIISLLTLFISCNPDDYYYKDLIKEKDIVYPGKIDSLTFRGGENRFLLTTILPKDSKVNKLILYWNNNNLIDSIILKINEENAGKKHEFLVENVNENVYNFDIYSTNLKGYKSVRSQTSGRVYGKVYKSSLVNRAITSSTVNTNGDASLVFITETSTYFKCTKVTYIDNNNITKTIKFGKEINTLSLPNYKKGTDIIYEAGYLPMITALDTIYSTPNKLILN